MSLVRERERVRPYGDARNAKKPLVLSTLTVILILSLVGLQISLVKAEARWTEYLGNPVFDPTQKAYYPSVLKMDTVYHMWYASEDGTGTAYVGHATSNDGIHWTDTGKVNGLKEKATHPEVIYDGTQYVMIYWLYAVYDSLYRAVSTDGLNWVDEGVAFTAAQFGGSDIYDADVIIDGSIWRAWVHVGVNIYYATSNDGINWVVENNGQPVFTPSGGTNWDSTSLTRVHLLKEGSTFHMFYGGGDAPAVGDKGIGHAWSADGVNWVRDPNNPIFHISNGKSWRDDRTYTPEVIKDGNVYKMWFTGKSKSPSNYAIGYATTSVLIWKSQTVTGSGLVDARDKADIEAGISATGDHTITCAKYPSNPGGAPTFTAVGLYYDVSIDTADGVDSLTIRFYYTDAEIAGFVESSLRAYWWTGTTWTLCNPQTLHTDAVNGYSGYIEVGPILATGTTPTLDDLVGTPFAFGTETPTPTLAPPPPKPMPPVGGELYSTDKLAILAPYIALVGLASVAALAVKRRRR